MKISEADAIARSQLWGMGIIAGWYLRDSQLEIYDLIQKEHYAFIEAARRFGKTTSIICFVLEKLIQNPGWICRWCFPNKNQAREVLFAEMEKIQTWTPESQKFVYKGTDSFYENPQGSKLYLRGVNEDRGDSARGAAANIIVADEYGFWTEPNYVIKNCLLPQLEGQDGRWLIKASTPPEDLGHVYYREKELAERKQRFIQKTIYDKETLTPEELQEIIDECGGITSPSFQRERLCLPVSNPESLVVPEWSDIENIVDDAYPRPQFFDAYVSGDSGADDNTFFCFAYYDFLKDEVVVEDEICVNGKTTHEIIMLAKGKELEHWKSKPPYRRVYDANKQLVFDLIGDHQYSVTMPRKEDKISSIHELRKRVGDRKFKVKERCRNLIRQLKVGMWKDERHTDFQRSEALGHLDGIDSAIYLNRSIDTAHNPWPATHGLSPYTHFIPSAPQTTTGPNEQALKKLFGSK